jgi:adenylosuccinate lyase
MMLSELTAISPVDGRYRNKTKELANYFSEYALFKYRIKVEIEYFISLTKQGIIPYEVSKKDIAEWRKIYSKFSVSKAKRIKEIEAVTNHDIKAVEYYIKEEFDKLGYGRYKEFIHFGLTSQDINNTAVPLSVKNYLSEIYIPSVKDIIKQIDDLSKSFKSIPMLAHTHGQPASPTNLGKELMVFIERLVNQYNLLLELPVAAKFGGATGNFNAHFVAYPSVDWVNFANEFITSLGLKRLQYTTQIEHYDLLAALFDTMKRINTILLDLSRDMWMYISMDYFKQRIKKGEVGSSAMPHKVNPIDFENAEGNIGIANAILVHLSEKLPVSRLQRDLSDSTVLRNIGVPFAHSLIAIASLQKGLSKLLINKEAIAKDLEDNWVVVAEAIQTVLRREGYANPYEIVKDLTRKNTKITQQEVAHFIDKLKVSEDVKQELKAITPFNYTGKVK